MKKNELEPEEVLFTRFDAGVQLPGKPRTVWKFEVSQRNCKSEESW